MRNSRHLKCAHLAASVAAAPQPLLPAAHAHFSPPQSRQRLLRPRLRHDYGWPPHPLRPRLRYDFGLPSLDVRQMRTFLCPLWPRPCRLRASQMRTFLRPLWPRHCRLRASQMRTFLRRLWPRLARPCVHRRRSRSSRRHRRIQLQLHSLLRAGSCSASPRSSPRRHLLPPLPSPCVRWAGAAGVSWGMAHLLPLSPPPCVRWPAATYMSWGMAPPSAPQASLQ